MIFILETFFSGCISKVINDSKDYSWVKIKSVINDRHDQNISTKIYRVIEKSLNIVTSNTYKNSDKLYDAIEKIFNEFKKHNDTLESVKCGLNVLGADASDQRCENFLEEFYQGIRLDDDLYKAIIMDLEQKGIKISQEEFRKINEKIDKNHTEIIEKIDSINDNLNRSSLINEENITTKILKFQNNKKQDYIKNWNSRLFLHLDNDERPITLADAFIMPDFEMYKKIKRIGFSDSDTLDQIIEKFVKYDRTSTMLITGVPGIGKSTITSWIANQYRCDDKVIILRFRDWEREELEKGLLRAICNTLECKKNDLEKKILVLDGFDEIKALDIRDYLLNDFFSTIKDCENLKCIITSRPAYINSFDFQNTLVLKEFDICRVSDFVKIITRKTLDNEDIIKFNLEVLGIPVILYMAIMSNVDISENPTKPELYNRIFAEQGGIFDKFSYDGTEYDIGSQILRDPENIKKYLNFLQEVSFKMFETGELRLLEGEYQIPKLIINNETVSILEFPIKNLFEGVGTNIEFVHKSIYEFLVSEYIYSSISSAKNISKEKLAGIFGKLFKQKELTEEIIEFLKFRVKNSDLYNMLDMVLDVFQLMKDDGMTYYTGVCYKNVIDCETNVFKNMLKVLHFWEGSGEKLSKLIVDIIEHSKDSWLAGLCGRGSREGYGYEIANGEKRKLGLRWADLSFVDLSGKDLSNMDFSFANLSNANLSNANLVKANLYRANLSEANLAHANLAFADLSEADLKDANLNETDLSYAHLCDADLYYVDLSNTYMTGVSLVGADLRGTILG